MRLTLRTLLAYRDRVLGPSDAEIIGQRIRDSQTARTIATRIDDLVSNPRVPAIPLDSREFGWDSNDVALFLDDAMGPDRLPAMERLCLENNSLLAEVASCHHILAQALREPIQVSSALGDRILGLRRRDKRDLAPDTSEAPRERVLRTDAAHESILKPLGLDPDSQLVSNPRHGAKAGAFSESAEVAAQRLGGAGIELEDRLGAQVPEYLRGADQRWILSTARLLILLALLGFCVSQALGSRQRLIDLLDRRTNDWSKPADPSPSPAPNER